MTMGYRCRCHYWHLVRTSRARRSLSEKWSRIMSISASSPTGRYHKPPNRRVAKRKGTRSVSLGSVRSLEFSTPCPTPNPFPFPWSEAQSGLQSFRSRLASDSLVSVRGAQAIKSIAWVNARSLTPNLGANIRTPAGRERNPRTRCAQLRIQDLILA